MRRWLGLLGAGMLVSLQASAQVAPAPPAGSGPATDSPAPSETPKRPPPPPPPAPPPPPPAAELTPEPVPPPDGGVGPDGAAPLPPPPAAKLEPQPTSPATPAVPATGAAPPAATPAETAEDIKDLEGLETTKPIPSKKGRIEGTVVDAKSGEALIEAQVTAVGAKKRVLTDIDGHYQLDLPPGRYDLRVFAELHVARRLTSVEVKLGKATRLDVSLSTQSDEAVAVQEVVVVAKPDTSTEAVQLVRRQKSSTVSDAISAEQIARTPDASASDAVKRVVGATVQDGKYVVIRGLGGRYSLTLLNGIQLPSPDPDLPSAPLDLFPSSLLANLTVVKTFTPDLPGNFAGGALIIETRDYPSNFTFKLRLGTTLDTQSTFRKVKTYEGGSLDFLGYDDGSRALPDAVPRDRPARDDTFTADQLATIGRSFNERWALWQHTALPSLGFGATIGDTVTLKGRKLGYLASVTYGNRWVRQRAHLANVGARNPDGSYLPSALQQDIEVGSQNATVGALLNAGFTLSPTQRIGLISIYTHNAENSATNAVGTDNSDNYLDRLRFRFLERRLQFNQLGGEHAFFSGRLVWNWQTYLAFTGQNEPDTRDLLRVRGLDSVYRIGPGTGSSDRTFGTLSDTTGGAKTDFLVPFKAFKLKVGGGFTISPRESRVRRFHFEAGDAVVALPPEQAFSDPNIGTNVRFTEVVSTADAFQADRYIYDGFAMIDILRLDPLRLVGGVRYEIAQTNLTIGNAIGINPDAIMRLDRRDRALLPAANLVYSVSERSNIRASYGGTVARPHLRELSLTPYFDYVRQRVYSGNPNLAQTYIHNADLRWETFLSGSEVLAVSGFYKYFDQPIERTVTPAGDAYNVSFLNADHAHLVGVELEARVNGARFSPKLEPFYLGTNLSYIYSRVSDLGVTRPLQGQSPYVFNAELGFHRGKTQLSLLYNVFGRRISEVGTSGRGDVYEENFHRLDLTWNQRLPRGLNLKVSGTNLLNSSVSFRQGFKGDPTGVEIYRYTPGVVFLAVLEWSYQEEANR